MRDGALQVAALGSAAAMLWFVVSRSLRRLRRDKDDDEGSASDSATVTPPIRLLCYGDSNTWGWDPFASGSYMSRYGETVRWPGVLGAALGEDYRIIEEGLNGRTTIFSDPLMVDYDANGRTTLPPIAHSHKPLDLVIIMLGTNDLKQHLNLMPPAIAQGAATLAADLLKIPGLFRANRPRVLLVCPPVVFDKPAWSFVDATRKSRACATYFQEQAKLGGFDFFDASKVATIPNPAVYGGDGIHLSAQNHLDIGRALADKVSTMLPVAQQQPASDNM